MSSSSFFFFLFLSRSVNDEEELRQLVGNRYRDLIDFVDSIVLMKSSCDSISSNIASVQRLHLCNWCGSSASSIADLSAVDTSLKAMELQVQSIKDRLREETEAIPKAKKLIDASLRQQKKFKSMSLHVPSYLPERTTSVNFDANRSLLPEGPNQQPGFGSKIEEEPAPLHKIDIAEEKEREVAALLHSVRMIQTQIDETNEVLYKERAEALKQSEARTVIAETSANIEDAKKTETFNVEIKKLQELLSEGKERADISEKKYIEAQHLNERSRKKLRETERMLYSMSDQFAELKMVVNNSLNLNSTSGPVASDELQVDVASDNSNVSTSGSEFAFAAPSLSPNKDDSWQLVVQDLSATEISDYEKWNGDRAGAFDDYF